MARSVTTNRFVVREFPYAVSFDANTSSKIQISGNSNWQTSIQDAFSVLAWVKVPILNPLITFDATIFAAPVGSINQNFTLGVNSATGFASTLVSDKTRLQVVTSTEKIKLLDWNLVGLIFKANSSLSIITNATIKTDASTITGNSTIQTYNMCPQSLFSRSSWICESMVLAGELTQAELNNYYWNGVQPSLTKKLHYRFLEGTGSSLTDSSGNGNTGTLINSPSWITDTPCHMRSLA